MLHANYIPTKKKRKNNNGPQATKQQSPYTKIGQHYELAFR
jgi:hypothetical protein